MGRTVFISSTSRDLIDYRRAVTDALLRAGYHPLDMVHFGARPEDARAVSLDEAGAADVFVGIYAWRYGTVPEGSPVSLTELELERAVRLGKPVFCFLIDESFAWQGERDDGEAAARLRDLKSKAALRVYDTFTTPADLATRVLASLGRWERTELTQGSRLDLAAFRDSRRQAVATAAERAIALDTEELFELGRQLWRVPESRRPVATIAAEHRRAVLLGAAGAGKTTALDLLEQDLLGAGPLPPSVLPLRLDLARLPTARSGEAAMLGLIGETLYREQAAATPLEADAVRGWLATGPDLFLLLDGLDQVAPSRRQEVGRVAADLSRREPRHRWLLTSRRHGFSSFAEWPIYELLPLDAGQIRRMAEKLLPDRAESEEALIPWLAEGGLPSLPLFLGFALALRGGNQRLRLPAGSVSGLLQAYVEELLARPTAGRASARQRLEQVLMQLAETSGAWSVTIDRRAAVALLRQELPDLGEEEAQAILAELCLRGFLAESGGILRFWHQTLQEYFFAASTLARWRGTRPRLPDKPPMTIRRRLREPANEDALAFAAALLADEEAEAAFRVAFAANPRLALRWADDLGLEGRAPAVQWALIERMGRLATRVRWLAEGGIGLAWRLVLSVVLCLEVLVAGIAFGALVFWLNGDDIPEAGTWQSLLLVSAITLVLPGIGWLSFKAIRASWGATSAQIRLQNLLVAIPAVRFLSLREALRQVAGRLAATFWIGRQLREAASAATGLAGTDEQELVRQLCHRPRKAAISQLGKVPNRAALRVLQHLIAYRNRFTEPALEALSDRARFFSAERPSIDRSLTEAWPALSTFRARRLGNALLRQLDSDFRPPVEHKWSDWILVGAFLVQMWISSIRPDGTETAEDTLFFGAITLGTAASLFYYLREKGATLVFHPVNLRWGPKTLSWLILAPWLLLGAIGAAQDAPAFAMVLQMIWLLISSGVVTVTERTAFPVNWESLEADVVMTHPPRDSTAVPREPHGAPPRS
jgi:hypothetical protein